MQGLLFPMNLIARIAVHCAAYLIFFCSLSMAQGKKPVTPAPSTVKPAYEVRVKQVIDSLLNREAQKFENRKIEEKREVVIEQIKASVQESRNYLKRGIDTMGIEQELEQVRAWYKVLGQGIFQDRDSVQTHRNLATSAVILQELIYRMESRKEYLDEHRKVLFNFTRNIDSLSLDSAIWKMPEDSAGVRGFLLELAASTEELKPADSVREQAQRSVSNLQKKVNPLVAQLRASRDDIQRYQKQVSDGLFNQEINKIWEPTGASKPIDEIFRFSNQKTILALKFYLGDNKGKIAILLLLVALATYFLYTLRKIVDRLSEREKSGTDALVLRYPLLSALVIVLNLYQFVFINPPYVLYAIIWIISAISLTLILRNYISRYWMLSWLSMVILGLLSGADNLILQVSHQERWWVLMLAMAGVVAGLAILLGGHRQQLRERAILYFIGFVVVFETLSVVANLYGRYNLAKTLMTTGFFNVVIAIMFLWTIRLINEGLALASKVYTRQDRSLFFINFERVGTRVSPAFYVLMVVGWLFLLGKSFYAFNLLLEPLRDFIFLERKMGDLSFSIGNLLLFFLILGISVITSRFVSYFASDGDAAPSGDANQPKNRLGSWLLLVRITILTLGLLLAFAATGIPMDRVTIILGALGVGIGLGLQALVNNLVSGLILAFEKPVNVGDIVEVGDKTGTVKSIGFRSSTLKTSEGADVIMPNGDLLNARLVNWTRGNTRRRVEIAFGVSYGADLEQTKKVLNELLASNRQILHQPAPMVLFRELSKQMVGINIYFWISHSNDWLTARSEIIEQIDKAFRRHGILIPFNPQNLFNEEKKPNPGTIDEEEEEDAG
jgi:small-conductance mechanosensitive channel